MTTNKTPPSSSVPGRNVSLLLVLLATAFWSTSGLFISLLNSVGGIPPIGIAFWRDLATFLVLLTGLRLLRPDLLRIRRRDLRWLALMGALSIGLFHVFWNTSIIQNGVAVATVIQSNAPIIVGIVAWLAWREPWTRRKVAALLLAILGTILISRLDGLGGQQISAAGLLVALASAVAYSTLSLLGKKLVGDYSPWTVLVYVFGFGSLTLLPFQIYIGFPVPQTAVTIGYFAGLVLLTTVSGFVLYAQALRGLQASVAAIASTAEVPFAAIVAYIFLDQVLDGWQIVGAILVMLSVVLLSWPRRGWWRSARDRATNGTSRGGGARRSAPATRREEDSTRHVRGAR